MARIADSDQGRLDADPVFDRAVGPMQFLPATWTHVGRGGNGEGVADPQNLSDAAQATAAYLCRFGPLNTEGHRHPGDPCLQRLGRVCEVGARRRRVLRRAGLPDGEHAGTDQPQTRRHARPDSDHRHHLGHRDRAVRRLGRLSHRRLSPASLAGS